MTNDIFKSVVEWQTFRQSTIFHGKKIGFVPTMGNLHEGHGSLLKRARQENDVVVLSIFVNPTQFEDPEDLAKYPRTEEADYTFAKACGVDYFLFPDYDNLYPDQYRYQIHETALSHLLCGQSRPGHFTGMLTVVMKLLQLVKPTSLYLGEKDYQQALLISEMCDTFFMDIDVVICPIVRDHDGIALSSRNQRLTPEERKKAAEFARILATEPHREICLQKLEALGIAIDYVEEILSRRLAAVRIGSVRLIDNRLIPENKSVC